MDYFPEFDATVRSFMDWRAFRDEVHTHEPEFDEDGIRTGDTPDRICEVVYPHGPYGRLDRERIARMMANSGRLSVALLTLAEAATDLIQRKIDGKQLFMDDLGTAVDDAIKILNDTYYDEDSELEF